MAARHPRPPPRPQTVGVVFTLKEDCLDYKFGGQWGVVDYLGEVLNIPDKIVIRHNFPMKIYERLLYFDMRLASSADKEFVVEQKHTYLFGRFREGKFRLRNYSAIQAEYGEIPDKNIILIELLSLLSSRPDHFPELE